ncbi:MAG: esterase/lipase family protein [Candidatus Methylomirabilales bacterium]
MATIIVHGTMTIWKAHHYTWWWNSFHPGGFCGAVAEGMRAAGRRPDVWAVGEVQVAQVPALARNPRKANMITHQGHYEWTGTDMDATRLAGGKFLAYYLNAIRRVASREPIDVIAHSHGGNVVKVATMARHLDPAVHLRNVVFLACPHWVTHLHDGPHYPYRLNPQRVTRVLNLYSEEDTIQYRLAAAVPGGWSHRLVANLPSPGRIDADPRIRGRYENYHVATKVGAKTAHSVMHGPIVGRLIGVWLAANGEESFRNIAAHLKPPVPIRDSSDGS